MLEGLIGGEGLAALINEAEAALVQKIVERFLKLGSATKLTVALLAKGMKTKGGSIKANSTAS
jgi:hypothetical protein